MKEFHPRLSFLIMTIFIVSSFGSLVAQPQWIDAGSATGNVSLGNYRNHAIDSNGNIYIAGFFTGTASFGDIHLTAAGGGEERDGFVAKLNSDLEWEWVLKVGSTGGTRNSHRAEGLAVDEDAQGNVSIYVSGRWNTASGIRFHNPVGHEDLFYNGGQQNYYKHWIAKITELDGVGGIWQWYNYALGGLNNSSWGMVARGNYVYAYGYQQGTITYPGLVHGGFHYPGNWHNSWIAKVDPRDGTWLYLKCMRTINAPQQRPFNQIFDVVIDESVPPNIYVSGMFRNEIIPGDDCEPENLPTHSGSGDDTDIWVAKLAENEAGTGARWRWAKRAGTNNIITTPNRRDEAHSIALDNRNNVYITGSYYGSRDEPADFGRFELVSEGGGRDIFVAKLDTNGNWQWVSGTRSDEENTVGNWAYSVAVDEQENVIVSGRLQGIVNFSQDIQIESAQDNDGHINQGFIARLDNEGNWLWAEVYGDDYSYFRNVGLDPDGNLIVTGEFNVSVSFREGLRVNSREGERTFFVARATVGDLVQLNPPVVNIEVIEIEGQKYTRLSWEPVENANSYKIFASDIPYSENWGEPIAVTNNTLYLEQVGENPGRFYHVIASVREP